MKGMTDDCQYSSFCPLFKESVSFEREDRSLFVVYRLNDWVDEQYNVNGFKWMTMEDLRGILVSVHPFLFVLNEFHYEGRLESFYESLQSEGYIYSYISNGDYPLCMGDCGME